MNKEFSKARKGYDKDEVDAFVRQNNEINAALRMRIDELTKKLEESESQLASLKHKQDLIVRSIMGAVQKSEQIENLTRQKYEYDMQQLRAFHERWSDYYNDLIAKFPLDSQLKGLNNFNRNMFRLLNSNQTLNGKLMTQVDKEISKAQAQFMRESARLGEGQTDHEHNHDNNDDLDGIPIFNPEETIRGLIRRQLDEEAAKKRRKSKTERGDDSDTEPSLDSDSFSLDSDTSDLGGFSYEEALNPKQELSEILKELGLDLD